MAEGALSSGYDMVGAYNWDETATQATSFSTTTAGDNTAQEIVASLARDVDLIQITYTPAGDSNRHDFGLNLAIGAAASEQIIVPDILSEGKTNSAARRDLIAIPIHVPAGQRLSYIIDSSASGRTVGIGFRLWARRPTGKIGYKNSFSEGYGTRAGVQIDPGGTAHTKGSWTEITASTAQAMKGFLVCLTMDQNNATTAGRWMYDLAVGAASSEQVIIENVFFDATGGEIIVAAHYFDTEIPSGSRIAVRGQTTVTDANDRLFGVSLVGFN